MAEGYQTLIKDLKESQSSKDDNKLTAADIYMKQLETGTPRHYGEAFDLNQLTSITPTIVTEDVPEHDAYVLKDKENAKHPHNMRMRISPDHYLTLSEDQKKCYLPPKDLQGALMDDRKLEKLLGYLDFQSFRIETIGMQKDEVEPNEKKLCCFGYCEPACAFGCGWVWSRTARGEDYLPDTGPPPLTRSDRFEEVFIEPKCMIKHMKRGNESYIMIISYGHGPGASSAPEVTIVPLSLIPPGYLGCDCVGGVINFYTWPKECKTENGEKFLCCCVWERKTAVTAKGMPFASVGKLSDPQGVMAKIHQLRGLVGKDESRPFLAREYSVKQIANHVSNRGVLNIYHEGYDTDDFSVRVDFSTDDDVSIQAYKEPMGPRTRQGIKMVHGFDTRTKEVETRSKRNWLSEDLHVFRGSGMGPSQVGHAIGRAAQGEAAVPSMQMDAPSKGVPDYTL